MILHKKLLLLDEADKMNKSTVWLLKKASFLLSFFFLDQIYAGQNRKSFFFFSALEQMIGSRALMIFEYLMKLAFGIHHSLCKRSIIFIKILTLEGY